MKNNRDKDNDIYLERGAAISPCNLYRYSLTRVWDKSLPRVLFIGLNPSTADAERDDATIRRCVAFAKSWGFGGLYMANLFAYRATEPRKMKGWHDPVGPLNDAWLNNLGTACETILFAWGADGNHRGRADTVAKRFPEAYCLGKTRSGAPRHPLYLKADTPRQRYRVPREPEPED